MKFTAEDFLHAEIVVPTLSSPGYRIDRGLLAEITNAKLEQLLAEAPIEFKIEDFIDPKELCKCGVYRCESNTVNVKVICDIANSILWTWTEEFKC